jgi:ATP-dependent Clp protease ATP-binding subunit ClpA
MFEKFTQKAITVIMHAQDEARRLKHNFVGTEQVLIGLISEATGTAAKCLKSAGVTLKDARVQEERIIGRGSGFVAVEIPFTPRAKRVLELTWGEARKLGHNYIDTEHLLLGLLTEGEGVAARVLENLGVNLNTLKTSVLEAVSGKKDGIPTLDSKSNIAKKQSYSVERTDRFAKITETSNSFLEFLITMLPPAAKKLVDELEEVVRHKEHSLRAQEYDKAAELLNKQIELTEKLRISSEKDGV